MIKFVSIFFLIVTNTPSLYQCHAVPVKTFILPQVLTSIIEPAVKPLEEIIDYPLVCFTPNKKCQSHIIREINAARESIRLQAFGFTDKAIATALVEAHKRGVDVKLILDKSNVNDGRSAKDYVVSHGVHVRIDYPTGIAHNKVIIIDKSTLITGSYNFSENAHKRNTENVLVLISPALCESYTYNWNKRWDMSYDATPKFGRSPWDPRDEDDADEDKDKQEKEEEVYGTRN